MCAFWRKIARGCGCTTVGTVGLERLIVGQRVAQKPFEIVKMSRLRRWFTTLLGLSRQNTPLAENFTLPYTLELVLRVLVTAARVPALAANQSSTASSKWQQRSHAWI